MNKEETDIIFGDYYISRQSPGTGRQDEHQSWSDIETEALSFMYLLINY
jgi:hypothetical protein